MPVPVNIVSMVTVTLTGIVVLEAILALSMYTLLLIVLVDDGFTVIVM